ncbi:MAG: Gfo/Idh/MocA family protein [Acidobacteriota bacterium]
MNDKEKEKERELNFSRREFIGTAAVAAAALAACGGPSPEVRKLGQKIVPGLKTAPDGPVLKAGLIGCGGRGTGAALNFLEAGLNLKLVALADVFQDRIESCREKLRARKAGSHELTRADAEVEVPDDKCFLGFDAYKKVLEEDVDIVILATPPHFRPEHFEATVSARKHVFMEKPVAVDPVGARSIMESAEKADAFRLSVVTGTQRRHQRAYIETYNQIADGAIGDIVAARCYWNTRQLWYKTRQEGWSDMEYMIRDWVNWAWLSGDHIVEQHVHNIDVINWFTNSHPVKAVGMGARMRRVTGDQYDFFDVDFELENGVHVHSMCRQVNGCANSVSEYVVGTKGSSNCKDTIYDLDGKVVWKYGAKEGDSSDVLADELEGEKDNSPYVQEHIDLVTAIRTDQPINEAVNTATSTLVAVMGRISAYTGQEVTWDELTQSDLRLGPKEYAMGPVAIQAVVPVPGTEGRA